MSATVGYFEGLYMLSFQFPIQIDSPNCKLIGRTNNDRLLIQINEVTEVNISSSGIAGATMKGQWRLTEPQWKVLVTNGGNWTAIGIPIVTNSPISGFQEYERQRRAPVRDRKKNFDDPVRRAIR